MTLFLSLLLGMLALFLMLYGIWVRAKTTAVIGFVLCLIGAYMVYCAWVGEQIVARI